MTTNILQPKVSVIVPMYNCEKLLAEFFKDMKNQSLEDYEMICVIDGATDNTLAVVKQHASEDNRIRYFYKENGGAGSARNYGLDYASGEYVIWIDADDRYSVDLLKELVTAADEFNADEVLCLCESRDYSLDTVKRDLGFNKEDFPENVCVNPENVQNIFQKIGSGPTNKLFRRSFIEKYNLSYSMTRIANDIKFIYTAIAVAKRVVGVHKHLITVQKCFNPNSITSSRGEHTQEIFIPFAEIYNWLKERDLFERHRGTFCTLVKKGILYNSDFGVNIKFVEETVRVLNEEEPWVNMSPGEIGMFFKNNFNIAKLKKEVKELEKEIQDNQIKPGQNYEALKRKKNRLEVIALVKTLSNVRYDRDFDEYKRQGVNRQSKKTNTQFQNEKHSLNYKIGSFITWLPRKIYYFMTGRQSGKRK